MGDNGSSEFHTFTFLSAFLYWQLLDNWTGILFWFSNCSGIVGLPSIINCSWPWCISGGIQQVTDHLFDIYLLFDILYLLWYLLFSVYCLAVVFNLYSFKSQREGNLTKASSISFVMWHFLNSFLANCEILKAHLTLNHTSCEYFQKIQNAIQ